MIGSISSLAAKYSDPFIISGKSDDEVDRLIQLFSTELATSLQARQMANIELNEVFKEYVGMNASLLDQISKDQTLLSKDNKDIRRLQDNPESSDRDGSSSKHSDYFWAAWHRLERFDRPDGD
jgi:ethanolamine utilization cobalamin adenosyltransferase